MDPYRWRSPDRPCAGTRARPGRARAEQLLLVAPARRRGLGLQFARTAIDANPGTWTVAFQDANIAAAQFWQKLAARLDPD